MSAETADTANTIPVLLVKRAAEIPQLDAIVDDDTRLTYAELEQRSRERAAWLLSRGVNKGHRVALSMPNSVEWAVNAYAVMRIGAVLVPLSTLLRPPELCAQLVVAGVRHLIATESFRGRDYRREIAAIDRATLPSLRTIFWADELGDEHSAPLQAMAAALAATVQPANDMAIIFTSGSSGTPKGVIHTHGNAIRANAAGLADRCVHSGARIYLPMPLFWVGGFAGGLISALVAGATLLTEAAPQPAQTLQFLARERATLFRGWPDQAVQLASHPGFASTDLSALATGSLDAVLPPALRGQTGSRARLFGMTETFGPYCGYALDRDMPEKAWGSCGQAFSGMQVRIVDPDSGTTLPNGEIGSIQVGGRNILRGICGREREDVFTADGWYDGGDLGRLDEDGFLYFVGRRDDMVKIKGATVYPSEVEAALESIPGVRRAFVTAIDVEGVICVGAAVVLEQPDALSVKQLQGAARERLSAFKLPARWALVSSVQDIPYTNNGKLDKPALQQLILANTAIGIP